jgi:hypothetical protein
MNIGECKITTKVFSLFQNHTAISRGLKTLCRTFGQQPEKDTLAAYTLFEALCQHHYDDVCVTCGPTPKVLVLDGNRKCAFTFSGWFFVFSPTPPMCAHLCLSTSIHSVNNTLYYFLSSEIPVANNAGNDSMDAFWDHLQYESVAAGLLGKGEEIEAN